MAHKFVWVRFEADKFMIGKTSYQGGTEEFAKALLKKKLMADKDTYFIGFNITHWLREFMGTASEIAFHALVEAGKCQLGEVYVMRGHMEPNTLTVGFIDDEPRNRSQSVMIWDVAGFFPQQTLAQIVKDGPLDEIMATMEVEIENLTDLKLSRPYGVSTYAQAAMKHASIESYMAPTNSNRTRAAIDRATAGGRNEAFYAGNEKGPFVLIDINGAYAHHIKAVPSLAHGRWTHVKNPSVIEDFGIYRVRFENRFDLLTGAPGKPLPLWQRAHNAHEKATWWAPEGEGWYWGPEARLARFYDKHEIIEGYFFEEYSNCPKPFEELVDSLHDARSNVSPLTSKVLKSTVQRLHGKAAQRQGKPRFQQFEWASYPWAATRAQLFETLKLAESVGMDAVFTVTDSIMLRGTKDQVERLNILGPNLGQWKIVDVYDELLVFHEGCWVGLNHDEITTQKVSGLPNAQIDLIKLRKYLRGDDWKDEDLRPTFIAGMEFDTRTDRVIGRPDWDAYTWQETEMAVWLGSRGQRRHDMTECRSCHEHTSPSVELHQLSVPLVMEAVQDPYDPDWIPE